MAATSRLPVATVLERDDVRPEPLTLEHVPSLHKALADAEVWEWLQSRQPVDETATRVLVVKALERRKGASA